MAMRTASPWWASLTFGVGLLFFALGERLFGHLPGARFVLTGLGLLLLLVVTGARAWTTMSSTGARRRVERTLLLCHLGTLLSLVLYVLTTDWGLAKLGLSDTGASHFRGAMTVLYFTVLVASIVPLLMVELSLGVALRTAFDVSSLKEEASVEYFRVREIGWSGLSVGLAMALVMVTCQVAGQRNVQRDVSYFKTSTPGESSRNIVANSSDPLKVLLFFPETNEVKDQVKGYFQALASATSRLAVEEHDRLSDAELAGKYKVVKDGTIVLVRGSGDKEKSQTIDVDTDINRARQGTSKLRTFDREVNSVLLKLMRDKRKAYLLVGHGEANDPDSIPADLKVKLGARQTGQLKKRLADLNYEVKNLGLLDLSQDVPDDATMVIELAPALPLQPAESAALERYLDRGGHLMLALEPSSDAGLGTLGGKLGLKQIPGHLTDEQHFLPLRRMLPDRRFVTTNQFSSHASTTSLSRSVGNQERGLVFNDAGALDDAPYTGKPDQAPKKTFTIHSMDSGFLDINDNFTFDSATEKKQRWNLAAAVEGPKQGTKDGYRALVFADADLFCDITLRDPLGRAVTLTWADAAGGTGALDDAVHWLGGEEVFSGEVVSEDDKPIQHTKNQDVVWFMLTIIGAPIIVLALGLFGTTRRRRGSKKAEVTL
jgi:hypothetical protein